MKSIKIHPDLIGSVPAVECLHDTLDELILRFEVSKPKVQPQFGLMSETDIKLYVKEAFKDPQSLQHMADGVAIELYAQHFYGLLGTDFDTMAELIDAINALKTKERWTSF